MFLKYEKTYRIPIPQLKIPGKLILNRDEVRELLSSSVDIEEKMDGANTGIIRHKGGFSLQKRGSLVGQSEHAQFQYFHGWANGVKYDNIMAIPIGYRVYGELCYAVHTIYYDSLPDYFIVFDVMENNRWLNRKQKEDFCNKYGFEIIPLINTGSFYIEELWNLVPDKSAFGDVSEGIVVKKYSKKKKYLRGKIVKPEFIKSMEESDHWTKYNIHKNKLRKT